MKNVELGMVVIPALTSDSLCGPLNRVDKVQGVHSAPTELGGLVQWPGVQGALPSPESCCLKARAATGVCPLSSILIYF